MKSNKPTMKKFFKIIYMDGYDEVRDADTHEIIFSTILPDNVSKYIERTKMNENVVDNVVSIWNKKGTPVGNLWSGGELDEYLLNEGDCTQEEKEIIIESLFNYYEKQ